jgi:hypothetical protein
MNRAKRVLRQKKKEVPLPLYLLPLNDSLLLKKVEPLVHERSSADLPLGIS